MCIAIGHCWYGDGSLWRCLELMVHCSTIMVTFFLRTNDGYFYWTVKQCARSALLVSVVLFISRCILGLLDATLILV
jgi:hypothetical protein